MRLTATITCLLATSLLCAGSGPDLPFTENKGQWPANVLYRASIPGGVLFVERDALTYVLRRGGPKHAHHDPNEAEEPLLLHAYRVTFEGARGGRPEGNFKQTHYENHFIGNDPAHWGTRCGVYGEVWVKGIYPGVDLRVDGRTGLKYDLVLAPGADPVVIRMRYDGQNDVQLRDGRIHVLTAAGKVVEDAPIAFERADNANGRAAQVWDRKVACRYVLRGNVLSFDVVHDADKVLVIDPTLTFASYSGSTADNFGCTATYDNDGHLYGAGIVFGIGYPVTLGVWQPAFAGGVIDMGITKWTPDGTGLVWSTYLGGLTGNESPHSMVVNDNDELYVLGTTGSSDFPVTPGCYDNSFNNGTLITYPGGWASFTLGGGYGFGHNNGSDIVVAHLSADATALLGCTYIGGTGNDGLNNVLPTAYNYGDAFRGEIALDPLERPVIATSTESVDIPTTPGAPMGSFGGGPQDAYIARLDPALTTLQWATYYGGGGSDAGYGLQFDSAGEIFVSGGTNSVNLPMAGSPYDATANGDMDGFIAHYTAGGGSLASSTYLGTPAYDQSYFVQLNTADEVFVVGQTHGAYPVTPGKYANPGSSQFIHKFSHDLSTSLWSTRIGNGSGSEDISPGAFLVSDCGQIYFSGWGGVVNTYTLAALSTTTGSPTTARARQSTTNGSDFWLVVLEPEATALHYATFFGGPTSNEHVDGGTSRFDKNGNVYQAVCAGCGSLNDFPTTPGAWSNTNNSFNCNLGVFKMALTQPVALIDISGPSYLCLPATANFINLSIGGTDYAWDFGDGSTSTAFAPSHTYSDTGTFVVSMILSDSLACTPSDTAYLTIVVGDPTDAIIDPPPPMCAGDSIQLQASGGTTFVWFPSAGLSDTTIANPWASPTSSITYFVIVSDSCGSDTASVDIVFFVPFGMAGPDTVMCLGDSVPITAVGGGSYLWVPGASLSDPAVQTPWAFPADTTTYFVTITTPDGCIVLDSLVVFVESGPPVPVTVDTIVCDGGSVQLIVSGGDSYAWDPAPGISDLTVPDPVVSPPAPMYYVVAISNACSTVVDSVFVDVIIVEIEAWPDTIVCPGETVTLYASGAMSFAWTPMGSLSDPAAAITTATPPNSTTYQVIGSDATGCADTAWVTVDLFPDPYVSAGDDISVDYGDAAQIDASGEGSFLWTPDQFINCTTCEDPVVFPEVTTLYTVQLTDTNGCIAFDQVLIIIDGTLYVPNTFTPDGDGINDGFYAVATEVKEFKLYVFNRWGEKIYETSDRFKRWDGTYAGAPSPIDTYVWRIDYEELSGEKHKVFGHVNLVR